MAYAILTPDGKSIFSIVFEAVPGGKTPQEMGLAPVNESVPDGKIRTGWQLVDGACEPVLADAPEHTPVVPEEVPMWAIRAVLDLAGLTPKIEAILEQLPQPDKTIVLRSWEYGNFIRRASPMIAALSAALDKTDAEVDQYFLTAASLNP